MEPSFSGEVSPDENGEHVHDLSGQNGVADNDDASAKGLRRLLSTAPELVSGMTPEYRAIAELKLRRKIDRRLLPMVILIYILNFLDRNNIASARLGGLEEDLGLVGAEYPTAVSILFVGYLLMQVPSNLFLNKTGKPSIYLPICMIIWGTISTCTAATHNFGGLLACRFFLGFVEAAYFPGCLYYLSCWFTRKELSLRYAILYSGALISGAFSGLIAAGVIGNMDGLHGLRSWRWLFIIEGSATIGVAFSAFFVLPDFPRTTTWLTEEERQLAIWRLEEDIGEDDWISTEQQSFFQGIKLAVIDIKIWILMVMLFCVVGSNSVGNFFPSVVQTLGYGDVQTLLLTSPPYVLGVATTFLNSWHADRTGERFLHVTIPLYFAIAAFIIAATTTTTAPRYFAMMLMVPGISTSFVVSLAWISNTLPRPPAKRAAAMALINAVANSSSIYTAYLYPSTAAPRYIVAMSVNLVTATISICMAMLLRFTLARLNRKLDLAEVQGDVGHVGGLEAEGIPVEGAKKGFRYML